LLAVIFEPFRRGDAEGTGLGLGLYIVRSIAQAHGGDVTVTSSTEHGTTFTIRLPVEGTHES
jgi:sigma-B regulation protein RsbU (phosphoserine phosphatase)